MTKIEENVNLKSMEEVRGPGRAALGRVLALTQAQALSVCPQQWERKEVEMGGGASKESIFLLDLFQRSKVGLL